MKLLYTANLRAHGAVNSVYTCVYLHAKVKGPVSKCHVKKKEKKKANNQGNNKVK